MAQFLLLDNYDSFTHNLYHYLEDLGARVTVFRNDEIPNDLAIYDGVVISPGPGLPKDAGCLMELLASVEGRLPVLGICLGMQAMVEHLGGHLYNQKMVKHGVQERINLDSVALFNSILQPTQVGLYHSWAVDESGNYEVIARSQSGVIMGIQNSELNWFGLQFHPESIMTPSGKTMLANFLQIIGAQSSE